MKFHKENSDHHGTHAFFSCKRAKVPPVYHHILKVSPNAHWSVNILSWNDTGNWKYEIVAFKTYWASEPKDSILKKMYVFDNSHFSVPSKQSYETKHIAKTALRVKSYKYWLSVIHKGRRNTSSSATSYCGHASVCTSPGHSTHLPFPQLRLLQSPNIIVSRASMLYILRGQMKRKKSTLFG